MTAITASTLASTLGPGSFGFIPSSPWANAFCKMTSIFRLTAYTSNIFYYILLKRLYVYVPIRKRGKESEPITTLNAATKDRVFYSRFSFSTN